MKPKFIMLAVLLFLVYSSFATAVLYIDNTTWDSMTAEGWTTYSGTPTYASQDYRDTTTSGVFIYQNFSMPHDEDWIIFAKMYLDTTSTGAYTFIKFDDSADNDWGSPSIDASVEFDAKDDNIVIFDEGATTTCAYGYAKGNGAYYNIEIRINNTGNGGIEVYIDDGLECTDVLTGGIANTSNNIVVRAIQTNTGYRSWWDNFAIAYDVATPSPTLTINTDMVNGTKNYNADNLTIGYNGTFSNIDTDLFNCTLYNVSTVLNTSLEVNLSQNQFFYLDTTDTDGTFKFNIHCEQTGIVNDTTTNYTYFIDSINPYLQSTVVNNSVYTVGDVLSYSWNCTDSNIFATNETIRDSNNVVVYNRFAENLTGTTYSNSTSYSLLVQGNFSIFFECWDSHTATKIRPINWVIRNSTTLIVGEDLQIWDSDLKFYNNKGNLVTYLALSEAEDKYKIKFTWETDSIYHTLKINYSSSLIPVFRKWRGHFVWDYQRGLDIEGENVKNVEITKEDGYYLIEIELYKSSDELETQSIFDLNYATLGYTVFVISETAISNQFLEDINQTLTDLNNTMLEVRGDSTMLWLIIMVALFFILGIAVKNPLWWNISGIGLLLMGFNAIQLNQTRETLFNFGLSIVFWTFGLLIMALAVFLFIRNRIAQKRNEALEFYNI